jgi:pyridoxamine 5'-phosphate oxidase family protein
MVLTEAEQRFLNEQRHGRLATVTRGGAPQVKPVGFSYNEALGTIDITGMNMAASAKYRNVQANPQVAFVADDVPAPQKGAGGVRFLEIRGTAETATATADEPDTAGHLAPEIIRIHPRRILGFNVDGPGLRVRDADGAIVASERWPHDDAAGAGPGEA